MLARLVAKDKPLRYIDTHAGAGGYDLRAAAAQRTASTRAASASSGRSTDAPAAVARWLTLAQRFNGSGALRRYPGSPWFARESLRPIDDLFLFELHPAEHRALKNACERRPPRAKCCAKTASRPASASCRRRRKRALTLIDPSYELRDEHRGVIDAVVKVHKRFATGVIAIWYPVIERRWVERYERALRATGIGAIATYELCVARERRGGGLVGSGMFIVNPPWQLDDELREALPWLAQRLAVDDDASHRIES